MSSLLPEQQLELDLRIPTEVLDPHFVDEDNVEDLMPAFRLVWFAGYVAGRGDTLGQIERQILAAGQ